MSFKCQNCGEAQPARTQPNRIVTEVREVGEHVLRREIVKERDFCRTCAKAVEGGPLVHTKEEPEEYRTSRLRAVGA